MESKEYSRLHDFEEWYWWCRAQRENLVEAVRGLHLPPGAQVLDAGCGTGRNLLELSGRLSLAAHGFDASADAAAFWNGQPGARRCRASINDIPYADGSFDTVCCVDVLGSDGVRIDQAFTELARVLRAGGHLVLLVPAYQWLLSAHDDAVHSVLRFTRAELRTLSQHSGLRVVRLTHRFPTFFPVIAGARLWSPSRRKNGPTKRGGSDLFAIPRWLNSALLGLARAEHALLRRVTIPFGTTILLVAQKEPR